MVEVVAGLQTSDDTWTPCTAEIIVHTREETRVRITNLGNYYLLQSDCAFDDPLFQPTTVACCLACSTFSSDIYHFR